MKLPREQAERELMRRWVETWQRAERELLHIRRCELRATDTHEAVRQLFGPGISWPAAQERATSGLVEQQAWFARLRR